MIAPPRLIGLPYDGGSSFARGAAGAPPLIRQALYSPAGNLWTEELRDLRTPGGLSDAGDLELPATAEALGLIEAGVGALLETGARPIALGGDHSVTLAVVRAVAAAVGPVEILQVDAHPDLYDIFEGDRLSHACSFARILEEGLATRLTQVGIRAMTGEQRRQSERFAVEVVDMRSWEAGERPGLRGPLYVSIDLDGLDPAFAPGVSHPESGGLSVRDLLGLVQSAPAPLVGADVVELNPARDPLGITSAVAAKLVKELASRMLFDGGSVAPGRPGREEEPRTRSS